MHASHQQHLESVTGSEEMIRCLLFISLLIHSTFAQKGPEEPPPAKKWLTLNGNIQQTVGISSL